MPVEVQAFVTSCADTADALADLDVQLDAAAVQPDCIFAFYSAVHDDAALHALLRTRFPGTPVIGGSSAEGVMSQHGLGASTSLGLLVVTDPCGSYGVAAVPLGDDPAGAAEGALYQALDAAHAAGELPELVWIYQHPGREEAVLAGLRRVVGNRCPIVGGSAGVQFGAEHHRQLGPDGALQHGVVVAALFPSGGLSFAYQSGFEPTGDSGIVTLLGDAPSSTDDVISGSDRHLLEIDGRPAAEVYAGWTGGALPETQMRHGGAITAASAFWPLGVADSDAGSLTYFRLVHVNEVSPELGLKTFAGVGVGTRVHALRGSKDSLISRASRVAATAVADLVDEGVDAAGALMAYCVGCRLALGDDIHRVPDAARLGFPSMPFLGCFTAGEQGHAMGSNVHSNLMISAVVFGR